MGCYSYCIFCLPTIQTTLSYKIDIKWNGVKCENRSKMAQEWQQVSYLVKDLLIAMVGVNIKTAKYFSKSIGRIMVLSIPQSTLTSSIPKSPLV